MAVTRSQPEQKLMELQSPKVEGSWGIILKGMGEREVQTMTFHLVRNPYYDSKRANVAGQRGH